MKILHFGAGVQSSTLAEMIVEGALPRIDMAIFADTRNEPDWVYRQVDYVAMRLASVDVPLVVVSSGHIYHDAMRDIDGGRFAFLPLWTHDGERRSRLKRQCTSEYKIDPAHDLVLALLLERGLAKRASDGSRRVKRGVVVESWMGFSWDELKRIRRPKRTPQWVKHVYPLIEPLRMTRRQCFVWLEQHNLPIPKKSSCVICPFHDNHFWLSLATHDPEAFAQACAFDARLRDPENPPLITRDMRNPVYLHRSCVPLELVDFAALIAAEDRRRYLPMFPDLSYVCGAHCMA